MKSNKFVEELKGKKIDYIITPEARGFLFATAVAKELNIGCIPMRKKGKLPPTSVEIQVEYEKEYGKDKLELPKLVNETYAGKRFYLIKIFDFYIFIIFSPLKALKRILKTLLFYQAFRFA